MPLGPRCGPFAGKPAPTRTAQYLRVVLYLTAALYLRVVLYLRAALYLRLVRYLRVALHLWEPACRR